VSAPRPAAEPMTEADTNRPVLVTGAAGFLGSHLVERLLDAGHSVRGVDAFTPYYPRPYKEANLKRARDRAGFSFAELDLRTGDLAPLLEGVEWVFHQAAQPGVRGSWGEEFSIYTGHNLDATHRLLEAARKAGVRRFIYASSSSVYGEIGDAAVGEDAPLRPISPYGVTKLAGEQLVGAYHREYGLAAMGLRYFTVCGPRQRPDMAFHKILRALHEDRAFTMFGDGEQARDFTYIADAVEANLLAARRGRPGAVYNIGGGNPVTLAHAVRRLEAVVGRPARIERRPRADGDPLRTAADLARAREDLGYAPRVPVDEALRLEAEWFLGPDGPPALESVPS